jgi:hypothetical protein
VPVSVVAGHDKPGEWISDWNPNRKCIGVFLDRVGLKDSNGRTVTVGADNGLSGWVHYVFRIQYGDLSASAERNGLHRRLVYNSF